MRAHLADWFEQAASASDRRASGPRVEKFGAPSVDELRDTPFDGDEDPLETLFRESS